MKDRLTDYIIVGILPLPCKLGAQVIRLQNKGRCVSFTPGQPIPVNAKRYSRFSDASMAAEKMKGIRTGDIEWHHYVFAVPALKTEGAS